MKKTKIKKKTIVKRKKVVAKKKKNSVDALVKAFLKIYSSPVK